MLYLLNLGRSFLPSWTKQDTWNGDFFRNVVTLLSAGEQLLCYTLARWSLKWCWCFHEMWLYLHPNYVHCSPYIKYLSNYDLSSDIKCNLMKLRWSANKDALLISVRHMEEGYKTWKRGKIRFCIFRLNKCK